MEGKKLLCLWAVHFNARENEERLLLLLELTPLERGALATRFLLKERERERERVSEKRALVSPIVCELHATGETLATCVVAVRGVGS